LPTQWIAPAITIVLLTTVTSPAHAQNSQREAYQYALRCYVATRAAGDEISSRRSFDAAMKLGRQQGLSNRQLNADLDAWTATELVKITRDPRYKQRLLGVCRSLGLTA